MRKICWCRRLDSGSKYQQGNAERLEDRAKPEVELTVDRTFRPPVVSTGWGDGNIMEILFTVIGPIHCSELKLERQLYRSWAADLIERIEISIGATGAQAARQCLRRLAKQWAAQDVVGASEVWVVENVEELGSEKKRQLLGGVKLPLQREIGLPNSETSQYIAPEIALLPGRRCSKGYRIESLVVSDCAEELVCGERPGHTSVVRCVGPINRRIAMLVSSTGQRVDT
jgi:hypothetical protein